MKLAEVYAKVPDVGCKGLCQKACGPIGMSRAELVQLRAAAGRRVRAETDGDVAFLRPNDDLTCVLLKRGRCAAYAGRPIICRLYGAAEGLECPHGCKPVDGGPLLTRREAHDLIMVTREARS